MPTKIEWCDETWNPVTGCEKVSQGCKHCYAERQWPRFHGREWVDVPLKGQIAETYSEIKTVNIQRPFTHVMCHPERLEQPLRWSRARRIFVNSISDLFHEAVPYDFIDHVFAVMAICPSHTFQILTKRPARMLEYLAADHRAAYVEGRAKRIARERNASIPAGKTLRWPLPHVWLGVSVEDQSTADERIPLLLETPAAVRWVSAEPLLGPVDLTRIVDGRQRRALRRNAIEAKEANPAHAELVASLGPDYPYTRIDWVVVGGESGPKARPMHPDWAYSLQSQCESAGVPFNFKQWGEWASAGCPAFGTSKGEVAHIKSDGSFWGDDLPKDEDADVLTVVRVGKKASGRLLGGALHDAYPQDRR